MSPATHDDTGAQKAYAADHLRRDPRAGLGSRDQGHKPELAGPDGDSGERADPRLVAGPFPPISDQGAQARRHQRARDHHDFHVPVRQ